MKGVKKKKIVGVVLLIVILIVVGFYFLIIDKDFFKEENDFEVKSLFLKINLKQGGSSIYNLEIENNNDEFDEFSININELEDFISSDEKIVIGFKEEDTIKLNIQIPEESIPGVYLGNLEVSLDGIFKKIPIILEVESEDILFDANIDLYPKGQVLVKGERLTSEIKLFDLANIGVRDIQLEYFVKDFDGRTIIFEEESKTIDGRLDYSKSFEVSEEMRLDEYVLVVVVRYQDSAGVSSVFFNVVDSGRDMFNFENLSFIVILFSFFFVIFIIIFGYYVFYRDKLFGELQRQYKRELKKQKDILLEKEKCMHSKLKTSEEKGEYKKEIGKIMKGRLGELDKIHKGRLKELKEIKGKGKINDVKKKVNEWKKQGYDTSVLESKFEMPKVKNIKKKVNEWKNKGYDTNVLGKKK